MKRSFRLNIGSLNVRGLGNNLKRKAIFKYFRDHQLDVILIQEAHCTRKTIKLWECEWGASKWIASSGCSNARGCAILLNNKQVKVVKTFTDHEGRYVIANIEIDEAKYTICNVYAPNEDSPNFFKGMIKVIEKHATENIVIGGDFNLTMNPAVDRADGVRNNYKSLEILNEFICENNMCDVWRTRNPNKRSYTWYKRSNRDHRLASRLDFFLVNAGVANKTKQTNITSSSKSDHCMITLEIIDNELRRGPGVWKFNDSLLKDVNFVQKMSQEIEDNKSKCQHSKLSDTEKWEYVKSKCRKFSQSFTRDRSKNKKCLLKNLHQLKHVLLDESTRVNEEEIINQISEKIKMIEDDIVQGSIYRSRCQWVNKGEKMSKYFFSLEKRKYANKTMRAIFLKDGTICTHQQTILKEQATFYEELYRTDESIAFNISNETGIKLTQQQKLLLEKEISFEEVKTSLFSMSCDKVPGCNGLTVSFYKAFFDNLKDPLWRMYQEVLDKTGVFGNSSKKGLISLIPKHQKDTRKLQNLRPLTLLCTDFKVLAKTMATRLKEVLPHIIGEQQNGFMAGRHIQDNIVTTMDVIGHVYQSGKQAVVITIDFEKCFDRIEHRSIYSALRYFNFGERYIGWCKIFFTDLLICTQNAGFQSEFKKKTRGVNQGCNLSPFLFLICGEIMAHLIKNNPYIRGVKVGRI